MSKWREEEIILPCGCKIGRTGKGNPYYYDYLCEIHLPEVLDNEGHFSYEKSVALTNKLNKEMKELEKQSRGEKNDL